MKGVIVSKVKKFISGEFAGWQIYELIWLFGCTVSVGAISILLGDGILSIIASVTGITYTILSGKGKISCYLFGAVNTILYGYVSMQNRLWGEVILNWGWYFPMMFAGAWLWKRKLDEQHTIIKTHLSDKGKAICFLICFFGVLIGGTLLKYFKDPQPFIDSLTTVLSIAAMILAVKRCSEQWIMWIIVNAASILMWFRAWIAGTGSVAVLLMWIIFLANGIIFYIKWQQESIKCQEN